MAAAQDETYRDAKNLHSKYLRHQAFEKEIAANKDRLLRLQEVSSQYGGRLVFKKEVYQKSVHRSALTVDHSDWFKST